MATTSRRAGLKPPHKDLAISASINPKAPKAVAETWEDAVSPSSSSSSTTPSAPSSPTDATPDPLPPTPISPTSSHSRKKSTDWSTFPSAYTTSSSSSVPRPYLDSEKRPEKSTAVAGRLIAGALGVRPPKKTEESIAYERAVREKERKKKEEAKEETGKAEKEKEEARRAIWEN